MRITDQTFARLHYPLLRKADLLKHIGGSVWFSCCDMKYRWCWFFELRFIRLWHDLTCKGANKGAKPKNGLTLNP